MDESAERIDATARIVRASITRIARRMRAEREEIAIGPTQLSVLGHLYRTGAMTPSALAAAERIKIQSLTRALATLEREGFVVRARDTADGRQSLIAITPLGTTTLIGDARAREAWLTRAMATVLSPTEREVVRLAAQLLDRLADAD